jgi:TRAP-type C4-dicarboxylate transport system permease small subunit
MSAWKKANNILECIFGTMEWLVRFILVAMTVLVSLQVVCRSQFNISIKWVEEVSLIGMIYVTFFTLALGIHYDSHLRIEMFVQWLPRRGRQALEFVNNLLLLFVSFLMVYFGWQLTRYGMASIMPATHLPTSIIYLPTPIAGFLGCIHITLRLAGIVPPSEVAIAYIDGDE